MIWGPLVGAIFLTPLEEATKIFVRNPPPLFGFMENRAGFDVMLFGIIVIIVVIYMPDGLVGSIPTWLENIRNRVQGKNGEISEATS